MRGKKCRISLLLLVAFMFVTLVQSTLQVYAAPEVQSPSVILMEASTGQIIYEKNAEERRSPASITKIMTMLLIFDFLENNKIHLDDKIMTSAYAKSMGGSQVFLEEGEVQDLDTLIKCIAVSSGNDAAVSVAEHIAGSEDEFVHLMNNRAEMLGLKNTHFVDCCGLTTSPEHYSCAKDVAMMSRELITKYPNVFDYTSIWMEDIIHHTSRGDETFTLSSTNKLLKSYEWATGLKTGSTSMAKYCLSATAKKDDLELIAVVMGAPDTKTRFEEAKNLLNFGYSVSHLYKDEHKEKLPCIKIEGSIEKEAEIEYKEPFVYLDITGQNLENVEKVISLPETITAPCNKGDAIGEIIYLLSGKRIGSVPIILHNDIAKANYKDYARKILTDYISF